MTREAQGSGRSGHRRRLIDGQAILVRLDAQDLVLLERFCELHQMSRAGAVREAVYQLLVRAQLLPMPLHPNGQPKL